MADKSEKPEKVVEQVEKTETVAEAPVEAAEAGGAEKPAKKARKSAKAEKPKLSKDEKMLAMVREQVQLTKDELKTELTEAIAETVRAEYRTILRTELKKANRRRRWNNFFHDVVIVILAVLAGYFGWVLYDSGQLVVWNGQPNQPNSSETASETESPIADAQGAGPVKDDNWYLANYSYLFDGIQTKLDADGLDAYLLYSNDYRPKDLQTSYLLGMAANQLELTNSTDMVIFSNAQMESAFTKTFGTTELYNKVGFQHGCWGFSYDKESNSYTAKYSACKMNQSREIVEEIERIYEEGEVIYISTFAAVRDKRNGGLYSFDNLFVPVALNVTEDNLKTYTGVMNRYQYQFKKTSDGNYAFAGMVKLF